MSSEELIKDKPIPGLKSRSDTKSAGGVGTEAIVTFLTAELYDPVIRTSVYVSV